MKSALTYTGIESLSHWSQILTGDELKHIQNQIISHRLKLSFGHHLIKLGHLSSALDTSSCLIKHQVNVAPSPAVPELNIANKNIAGTNKPDANPINLFSEFDELALATNSVDLVLMNHELEFSNDPHQVLREVHRVLMPSGDLVLSVFNPFSLFMLSKIWPFKTKSPLWQARMFSIGRIKDWLDLLGFEIIEQEYCCYSSLFFNNKELKNTELKNKELNNKESNKSATNWLQQVLKKYLPQIGSVCIITAKKREWPLTPIRSRNSFKSAFQPAVSRASSQSAKVENSDG
jgi:ubiquinone/menaquinone biosynthesis C-methylase UbiE